MIDTSTISVEFRHRVFIRHPGYSFPHNVLLFFGARDHAKGGIHHETARIACGIVAGNRWDGYFTENLNGPRVVIPPHGILLNSEYFFSRSVSNIRLDARHLCFVPNVDK